MGNLYTENHRIRSLRTKKRIVKESEVKHIRKLEKKSRELWKIRREIPLVPLEKPYQKGFVRFFVLRDDVARAEYQASYIGAWDKSNFFQGILDKINTFQYSDSRKFQKKKRRKGKKIYVPREQKLKKIPDWQFTEYKKLKFSEKEQKYFIKTEEYNSQRKVWETFWEFSESWRFVLRIKPNMITHYRPLNPELESEIAQLDKILDQHRIRGILHKKIWHHKNYDRFDKKFKEKEKYKYNNLKNNNLHRIKLSAIDISNLFEDNY